MARSFLFASDSADTQTTRLLATATAVTGFMKGEPGSYQAGWYAPGRDNSAFLHDLLQALRQAYPDAGTALWAVRTWTNLTWQLAYLAVIAVHDHGAVPRLAGVSQRRNGIYVDNFRLATGSFAAGTVESMIEDAGAQLRDICGGILDEVNAHIRLRPILARRLLAERILSLVVRLARRRSEISTDMILDWTHAWLIGLDLVGQGDLEIVALPNGTMVPIVRRKGCCLDYLVTPDRLCANCPKQDRDLRIARQLSEHVAETN